MMGVSTMRAELTQQISHSPATRRHSPPLVHPTPAVKTAYSAWDGFTHLASGLSCGLSSLAAGLCIGIVGDAGVRANGQQKKLYVPMILILIFAEALGLYGLIIGIILSQKSGAWDCDPPSN